MVVVFRADADLPLVPIFSAPLPSPSPQEHLGSRLHCTGLVELVWLSCIWDPVRLHWEAHLDCTGMVELDLAARLVTFGSQF